MANESGRSVLHTLWAPSSTSGTAAVLRLASSEMPANEWPSLSGTLGALIGTIGGAF